MGTTLLGRVLLSAALCPSAFRLFHFFSSSDPREKITFVVRVFSWGWGEGGDCHFGRGLWDFLAKLWFYSAAEMPGMLFLDLSFRIQGI